MHERDPVSRELSGSADPRQHQELRRHEGSRRQDDLAAADLALACFAPPSDPDRALALHEEAGDGPVAEDGEVRPMADRIEIGSLRGLPLAVALREHIGADAVLAGTVEIRIQRIAGLLRGFEVDVEHRVDAAQRRDVERSRRAVEAGIDLRRERPAAEPDVPSRLWVGQEFEALDLPEIGKQVVVAPADIAEVAPMVEILALASHIDLAVDIGAAPRASPARQGDGAALQSRLRFALEPGHEFRATQEGQGRRHEGDHGERHLDDRLAGIAVRTGLDQRDAHLGIFAQPVR